MGHRVLAREENPDLQIDRLRKRVEALERRWHPDLTGDEGCGARARLGISSDFTIAAGTREIIEWDIRMITDPTVFDFVEAPPGTTNPFTAIQPLVNGIYACSWATYVDTSSDSDSPDMVVDLSYATWIQESVQWAHPLADIFLYPTSSYMPAGTWVFPSGPDYDPVFLAASTKFGSTGDLVLLSGLDITFMEMILLCQNNDVGNPYDWVVT